MTTFTTTDGTGIFYKDWGSGQPILFAHGWPLSSDAWDQQMLFSARRVSGSSHTTVAATGVRTRLSTATIWISMRTISLS